MIKKKTIFKITWLWQIRNYYNDAFSELMLTLYFVEYLGLELQKMCHDCVVDDSDVHEHMA